MESTKKIKQGQIEDFMSNTTKAYADTKAPIDNPVFTGTVTGTGSFHGVSFVKDGGTPVQILAADGSVIIPGPGISIVGGVISAPSLGITNLGYIGTTFNGTVTSSTGTSAVIPLVGAIAGLLSPDDYIAFQGKQGAITLTVSGTSGPSTFSGNILNIPTYTLLGLGGIGYGSLTAVPPLVYNGAGVFSITQSTTSSNGYLSSVDWNIFYNKQNLITLTTTGTSGASTLISDVLNIPQYSPGTVWMGNWNQQEYLKDQQVLDEGYLAIANKTTSERPSPQRVGEPFNIYQGTIGSASASNVRQIIFGNQYTFTENVFFEGWRINVVAGNRYTVYLVKDPGPAPHTNIISQIIQFVAQSSGWVNLSVQPLIIQAGNTYAVVAAVTEPEAVTTFSGTWNMLQPQNTSVPLTGEVIQSKGLPSLMRIHNFDSAAVDRSAALASLSIGDTIKTPTNLWAIQSKTAQTGYFEFGISPALLNVTTGAQNFDFEVKDVSTLTYPVDPDPIYWTNHPSPIATVQGLLGIDESFQDIEPNTSAYGIGVLLQTMIVSADWDIQAFSGTGSGGGSGGGGGASTLDDLTDVEIITPLNNDVLAYETLTGLWKNKAPTASGVPVTRVLNINGNAYTLENNIIWRVAQGDTGVLMFDGLSANTTTSITVGAITGYIVNNETSPRSPSFELIEILTSSVLPIPTTIGIAHYVLMDTGGTLITLPTFPTSLERKRYIYLGKVGHVGGVITSIINEPDFITSPLAQSRDIFRALGPFINSGVYPFPNGANLNINVSAGDFFGNGINFIVDNRDPDRIPYLGSTNTPISYRLRNGVGGAATPGILPSLYDNGTASPVAVPGGPNVSTNQYLWAIPGIGGSVAFLMQYGQFTYNSLDLARAAVGKEANIVFANLPGNAILIAVLSVRNGASNLSLLTDGQFFKADKLGQMGAAGGGTGTPTDLVWTATPTNATISSSTGLPATATLATAVNAGLLSPADFTKLTAVGGKRVVTVAFSASMTPNAATTDIFRVNPVTGNLALVAPSGVKTDGQMLLMHFLCDITARTLLFPTASAGEYLATTEVAFPTTLIPSKWMKILFQYSLILDRWECIAVSNSI